MECTQRLECTQDLYDSRSERICPEQIGFLGICGVKHPIKKGPNKIGRDPQTCTVVLNLNSISRQHAVINVLNQKEYMLMDLDSANKTKLEGLILPPYIPQPLKNGNMVQFGDVFGVFRLLEEDTDLPMTQAIDNNVPETPVSNRHVSKINKSQITTIPESPDVSDKDDSFIVPSQPKSNKCFRSSNIHFVKPSSKTISIQPIGTNKIDNVYWNSSKKSVSLNSQFNDSDSSPNKSTVTYKTNARESNDKSIYEMETQAPALCEANDSTDSIYTANTQVPPGIHMAETQALNSIHTVGTQDPNSIHNADTQAPSPIFTVRTQLPTSIHTANTQATSLSPPIHSINTQLPESTKMKIDLCTANNINILKDAIPNCSSKEKLNVQNDVNSNKEGIANSVSSTNSDVSAEEIILEEMDCQEFDNEFESQALLPIEILTDTKLNENNDQQSKENTLKKIPAIKKPRNRIIIDSDSSTDCEDIDMLQPQKVPKIQQNQADDEDVTDCEDLFDDAPQKPAKDDNKITKESKVDNFEDLPTQVITLESKDNDASNVSVNTTNSTHDVAFEDILTQVIPLCDDKPFTSCVNLEDMPTQIIIDENEDVIIAEKPVKQTNASFEHMPTQVKGEIVSPFKIPLMSPLKAKRKDIKLITQRSKPVPLKVSPISDENYYAATQDILEDLCTQPDIVPNDLTKENEGPSNNTDDDFLPSSVEDYTVGNKFPHLEKKLTPRKIAHNSSMDSSDGDDKVDNFVSKLTSQQVRDVIGVETVDTIKREPSDPSDIELTPKKVRPIKFMDIDLPNSQEIKTGVSLINTKPPVTESSSESEVENDSEECTPILFSKKKKKSKATAKVDLSKVFAAESLPTRVITRVRKPTSKYQNEDTPKVTRNILKPKYLTEEEDVVDKDIISENISRLKSNIERSKYKDVSKESVQESKITAKVIDQSKSIEKENTTTEQTVVSNENVKSSKNFKIFDSIKTEKNKNNHRLGKTSVEETKNETTDLRDKSKNNKKQQKASKKELSEQRSSQIKKDKTDTVSKIVSPNVSNNSQVTNLSIETSIESKPTRSTRNRRKANEPKEEQSVSLKEDIQSDKKSKPGRKQNLKNTNKIDSKDEIVETRRSRRQQKPTTDQIESKGKTKNEETKSEESSKTKPPARRGRPPKQGAVKAEQSTIYSLSSDSDTPKSILKRPAPESLDPPSSKRTRSSANSNVNPRATPAKTMKTQYVLFTAFPSEEVKAKLEKLGAVIVTDVRECTMVLTLAVRRTFKLLCAVGLGRPIVGPNWVQACVDTGMIVDPWLYILKDEVAEKRFQFSLEQTLTGKRDFLNGFNVSSTPSVLPNKEEMKLIVECSGGTWKDSGPQWVCVSCMADKALWAALKRRGATVVSTEFILGGVLRQRPDITKNKLL